MNEGLDNWLFINSTTVWPHMKLLFEFVFEENEQNVDKNCVMFDLIGMSCLMKSCNLFICYFTSRRKIYGVICKIHLVVDNVLFKLFTLATLCDLTVRMRFLGLTIGSINCLISLFFDRVFKILVTKICYYHFYV